MDNGINNLLLDIDKIINFIKRGYEIHAKTIFSSIKDKYSHDITPESNLHIAIEIWVLLDEYLNTDVIEDDISNKKNYLLSAYEDFLVDVKGPLI